jgi:metal-responsive CopG/Arc/MetJ family transcriptional regulator
LPKTELTQWYNFCYTLCMKTAISIPDNVYETAEKLANRLGKSRSQLYTQALDNYISKHQKDGVTEKLNEIYASTPSALEQGLNRLQLASLPREEW